MKHCTLVLLTMALLLGIASSHAQTNLAGRGTIIAVEGDTLAVKSRDGKDLRLKLAHNVTVAAAKAMTMTELKPGDYVGVTAISGADGALVAREVHTSRAACRKDMAPGTSSRDRR